MIRKKFAFVVSTVGFHWEELASAYQFLAHSAGCEVHFFTPNGKTPIADPLSLIPRKVLSHFGLGSPPEIAPLTEFGKNLWEKLRGARSIVDLNPKDFSGLYLPGGHGCLFDVNTNPALHSRILEFYQHGKPLGAVCHATSTFAFVEQKGVFIVEGKRLTGFPDLLDDILIPLNAVDENFLPLPLSNDGRLLAARAKNPLSQRLLATLNPYFYVVDAPFVTGVGPKAALSVAQRLHRMAT